MTKITKAEAHEDIGIVIDGSIYAHSQLAGSLAPNPTTNTFFEGYDDQRNIAAYRESSAKEYILALRKADPKRADLLINMVSIAVADWWSK